MAETQGIIDGATPKPRLWPRIRPAVYLLLIAIVFYFVGRSLLQSWKQIVWEKLHLSPAYLAAALAALFCNRLPTGAICDLLLKSFGSRIGYARATAAIWSAAMGRYIPGKTVAVVGAVVLLTRQGIRMPVALAALFLSTALTIVTSLLIAAPILMTAEVRARFPWAWGVALAIIAAGVVCLHPRIFGRLCNVILRLLKRPPLPAPIQFAPFMGAVALIVVRCCFLGLSIWLTTRALMPVEWSLYPRILSSATLAASGGFLFFFVPAGLGAQEWIYVQTLRHVLGEEVIVMAAVFRLLQVIIDAITGATGLMLLRRDGRSRADRT